MWFLIWKEQDGDDLQVYSFTSEPTNEDILSCSEYGWDMVGYPVEADTQQEAIEAAAGGENGT